MTNNQQLELLNKAVAMGAHINVSFHTLESKQHAVDIMSEFTSHCEQESGETSDWLYVEPTDKVRITAFYKQGPEDKIAALERQIAALRSESA